MKLKTLTVAALATLALGIGPPTLANQPHALVELVPSECNVGLDTRVATWSCEEGGLQTEFGGDGVYQVTATLNKDPTLYGPFDIDVERVRYAPVTEDGLGFRWKDVSVWKRGVQWQYDPRIRLRAGVADSNQPAPSSQALFDILGPGVPATHYTVGVTYRLNAHSEIGGSLMQALRQRVGGTNPNPAPKAGFIQMEKNEFELTYTRYLR